MASSGDPDAEMRVAIAVLGASGLALVLALKSICSLFREREAVTGRRLSDVEIDALLTLAAAAPGMEERLASVERTLPAIVEKLDTILARSSRRRVTDG